MSCEVCGQDDYPGEETGMPELEGLRVCEGCDMPTDACRCMVGVEPR
jgi:hypothetical protein